MSVTSVYIAPMKCSNGLFFYTKFQNSEGETISPFMSQELWKAIHEGDSYADFFGLELDELKELPWLSQELIDEAYKEARKFDLPGLKLARAKRMASKPQA